MRTPDTARQVNFTGVSGTWGKAASALAPRRRSALLGLRERFAAQPQLERERDDRHHADAKNQHNQRQWIVSEPMPTLYRHLPICSRESPE
jgi:hypothetical protein